MASKAYELGIANILETTKTLEGGAVKVVLVKGTYSYSNAHDFYDDTNYPALSTIWILNTNVNFNGRGYNSDVNVVDLENPAIQFWTNYGYGYRTLRTTTLRAGTLRGP